MNAPLRIFVGYARADSEYFTELARHLRPLEELGTIRVFHESRIEAGQEAAAAIRAYMECSDLILLFVSADLLASCMPMVLRAEELYRQRGVTLIPVRLRSVSLQGTIFCNLKSLPQSGGWASTEADREATWVEFTELLQSKLPQQGLAMAPVPTEFLQLARPAPSGGYHLPVARPAWQSRMILSARNMLGLLAMIGLSVSLYSLWEAKSLNPLTGFQSCLQGLHSGRVTLVPDKRQDVWACAGAKASEFRSLLKRECEAGALQCCHDLGDLLLADSHLEAVKEAVTYFRKACSEAGQDWRACIELGNLYPQGSSEMCNAFEQAAKKDVYGFAELAAHDCGASDLKAKEQMACDKGVTFACVNLAARVETSKRYLLYWKACQQLASHDRIYHEPGCTSAGVKACLEMGDHFFGCRVCKNGSRNCALCAPFRSSQDWKTLARDAYHVACVNDSPEGCRKEKTALLPTIFDSIELPK